MTLRNVNRELGIRHRREGSQHRFINDQVTALANQGFIPLGTFGRWCGMYLRVILPKGRGNWSTYLPASIVLGCVLRLSGIKSPEPFAKHPTAIKEDKRLFLKRCLYPWVATSSLNSLENFWGREALGICTKDSLEMRWTRPNAALQGPEAGCVHRWTGLFPCALWEEWACNLARGVKPELKKNFLVILVKNILSI